MQNEDECGARPWIIAPVLVVLCSSALAAGCTGGGAPPPGNDGTGDGDATGADNDDGDATGDATGAADGPGDDDSGDDDGGDDGPEVPMCQAVGAECGVVRDWDGTTLDCGECPDQEMCVTNRCEPVCSLEDIHQGRTADLRAYIPLQVTDKDLAGGHPVETELLPPVGVTERFPFVSQTDLRERIVRADLGTQAASGALTLSFKVMPTQAGQSQAIMTSDAFTITDDQGAIRLSFGAEEVSASQSTLKVPSCNHYAAVITGSEVRTVFNGVATTTSVDTSALLGAIGELRMGEYDGKVWDVRIYDAALTDQELGTLGENCTGSRVNSDPSYDEYMCGPYYCIWWSSESSGTSQESFDYQLSGHEMVYEHNVLRSGMYTHTEFCAQFGQHPDAALDQGYLDAWVNNFNHDNPWNSYVLHENFHSYQSAAGGGPRFLLESSANFGAYSQMPGIDNNPQVGMFTLRPHLPLNGHGEDSYADGVQDFAIGGHMYGAGIYIHYITEFYANDRFVGDLFNHPNGDAPAAAYEVLGAQGWDMRDVYIDYASKVATWDWPGQGPGWREGEAASLNRMHNVNSGLPPEEQIPEEDVDAKLVGNYGPEGTNGEWTAPPARFLPGNWAHNIVLTTADATGSYEIGVEPAADGPGHAEFRARVVVYSPGSEERIYHDLEVGGPGEQTFVTVDVEAGDEIYLVFASTPSTMFYSKDAYSYRYTIGRE